MASVKIKTQIYFLIRTIILLLMGAMVFSMFTINRLKNNLQIQVHTTAVILGLKDNLTTLLNAETVERGFIITSDTNYLELYHLALQNVNTNLKQRRTLTKDNPVQQKNIDTLENLISQKLTRITTLIALKKQNDWGKINAVMVNDEGKYIMDKIRPCRLRK